MDTTPQTALIEDQAQQPGRALTVRRFFTSPGVHPFDAVEWETRDAFIGHGGNVAFEQKGVEFPKSWSQNATNIVAQKYFRGQLDSPARERSVKQMIGRVAGTIADWGRARGYFASAEDGDAFEAELTHILLHQMAAFNSPVWFNVGFEESPQVSACFILSVEDTMDSILDWNTKEGRIFRGGSGSGINLSRIRGSMEPLSKGGTASGPVSFMRGADSWAGTIKSGGKTRRAAKMVVLDVDHPDIREFIWCKAKEEDKAAALRDAGFDMSIDGDGFLSIQYQNANNSVRVTDEFMRAVENDEVWRTIARSTGEPIGEPIDARQLMREIAEAAWRCADPGVQYDTTINQWHTCPNSGRINASNPCSEYLHVDDSACNLASLNLMKFRREDGTLDIDSFNHAVDIVFLAQEIVVGPGSYPTDEIAKNARAFRQLGLGYANLGAYLMANGVPYDSDEGRATAAGITALMTARGYLGSARIAAAIGPYEKYEENRAAHNNVMRMHRDASYAIPDAVTPDTALVKAARTTWDEAVAAGEAYGYRNAQATVLAPTGCLVPGSLVCTSRGLVRLGTLGDQDGPQWQDLDIEVATDEGPRPATKFYVNGSEQVVSVQTARGYRIQGTPTHRIKVVDAEGDWTWRRMAEIRQGDRVPMMLNSLVGEPQEVALPPLGDLHWNAAPQTRVPRRMTAELAELVGYFMGDGSLHAKGLRLCVADGDGDGEVVDRLVELGRELFGLEAHVLPCQGYTEVSLHSVALTIWWEACGFAKQPPFEGHSGKGWTPHIPDAVLHANDREVYAAFVRGLFEADGNASNGYVYWCSSKEGFVRDVQTLLLTLGFVTTYDRQEPGQRLGGDLHRLRLLNAASAARFAAEVGFISARKNAPLREAEHPQAARHDQIPVSRELLDGLAPENDGLRKSMLLSLSRTGTVSRRSATALLERAPSVELEQLLGYFYDEVASAELIEDHPTFDLSVPDNVTYVANGFVSHNTISFLMDCDTTGVEPDFSLVKFKELVGGGTMTIANRTIPMALRNLGYAEAQIEQIEAHVAERGTIVGAPGLSDEHLPVFDVAVGQRAISHMGHIKMMGAVQPFISGAISKCITGESLIASEQGLVRIRGLHEGEAPDSFRDMRLEVSSLGGRRATDAFYYGGSRPVRRAVLRSGHRITGTANHRLLVAADGGLQWRRLDELEPGDRVATKYGDELWATTPARFGDFQPTAAYGSQKRITVPAAMTAELAFFLGAFAAEGHISRTNWTIRLANADEDVISRLVRLGEELFGFTPRVAREIGKCPSVELSSKTLVEFFDYLGTGDCSATKRIPDAVLQSPRPMVAAFLSGLSLDCYLPSSVVKWAICLASNDLLDDLQAVLTNMGIVHSRIRKHDAEHDTWFEEVYAAGRHAQSLVRDIRFPELHKALRAATIASEAPAQSTADVVPGVTGNDLYTLIPTGRCGRAGRGTGKARTFSYLKDRRTQEVSRTSLERVALVEGVELPDWLDQVLSDNLYFSPVESVEDAGVQEVFDVSVPGPHAFVANGIVNHNTVNMPNESTVEDIADAYIQAWSLGIKALAIYRDGSKTAQALRTDAQESQPAAVTTEGVLTQDEVDAMIEKAVEDAVVKAKGEAGPARHRMPRERQSITHKFNIGGHEGYITAGMYEDGTVGEIFITDVGKEGSTLRGMMNSFATAISIALQYGVPLETLVQKFAYMRFEPEGITQNPEIPFAKSMPDYIMRWLASRFLDADTQEDLGILTAEVRARKIAEETGMSVSSDTAGPAAQTTTQPATTRAAAEALTDTPPVVPARMAGLDLGPACSQCGGMMQRTGSCYTCSSCGNNTGCG